MSRYSVLGARCSVLKKFSKFSVYHTGKYLFLPQFEKRETRNESREPSTEKRVPRTE
jgi:hypothetical protein